MQTKALFQLAGRYFSFWRWCPVCYCCRARTCRVKRTATGMHSVLHTHRPGRGLIVAMSVIADVMRRVLHLNGRIRNEAFDNTVRVVARTRTGKGAQLCLEHTVKNIQSDRPHPHNLHRAWPGATSIMWYS